MSIDAKHWEILTRGVVETISENELKAKLAKGKPLNIKLGVDPTTPDIHLGHTVVMRKLRQFQDLGHRVILIVGDYTATVGDPSGRNKTRPPLDHAQVMANAESYKQQFFKIVDPAKTVVRYNGEWFGKMPFLDVIKLMGQITVAQMLEREDFKNRYEGGQPISLHEFLYPLMQGHDSVEIDADVELGGTDQKFNVLRGRELQRAMGMEPQVGMFLPILLGTDGHEKMSKSLGNYIGIDGSAQDMFHKLFALPDSLVASYFELLTDVPHDEVQAKLRAAGLAAKEEGAEVQEGFTLHPNTLKEELAINIVSQYHGREAAEAAAQTEKKIHAGDILPENMPVHEIAAGEHYLAGLIVQVGLAKSNSEARRLIENSGVSWDDAKVRDVKANVTVSGEHVLRTGKRAFVRIVVAA
jgi:tyrosyl-tRNA synthetase